MSQETINFGHWVIDNDFLDAGFERKKEMAIESINSQVLALKGVQDQDGKSVSVQKEDTLFVKPSELEIKYPFSHKTRKELYYYKKAQHWIGTIIKINEDFFVAKLVDKNDGGTYETAEFDFNEVSRSDRKLIKKGGVFYFSLGFASNNGQIKKESFLRFKRNVPFNDDDINKIEERVNKFDQNINWD